jgi:hypothetical protein
VETSILSMYTEVLRGLRVFCYNAPAGGKPCQGGKARVDDELENGRSLPRDERRVHDRSRLIVDLFFNGADATGVASTQDIGLGGLYMNTQVALPEGSLLTLRIPVGEEQIVVNAEVVYVNPGRGVGVRFHGLSEKDRDLMERGLHGA